MESEPRLDEKTKVYSAADLAEALGDHPDHHADDNARLMPTVSPSDAIAAARQNLDKADANQQASPRPANSPGDFTAAWEQEAQVHAERLDGRASAYLNGGPKLLKPFRAFNLWLHRGMPPER